MPGALRRLLCTLLLMGLASSISAQFRLFGPRSPKPTPQPRQMRKASAYISRQEPLKLNKSFPKQPTPTTTPIFVSRPNQPVYRMMGDATAPDGRSHQVDRVTVHRADILM